MKEMVIGGLAVVGVGLATYFAPPFTFGTTERVDPVHGPIYALATEDAVARLMAAKPVEGALPFGNLDLVTRKVGDDAVKFSASGAHARFSCLATVFQARSDAVQVKTTCTDGGSPSDGAAAPAVDAMKEIGFREFVDSTMQQRAYDQVKVQSQSAAAMMRNMPQMQADALKMHGEMNKMIAQQEADSADDAAESAADADRAWLEGDVDTSE